MPIYEWGRQKSGLLMQLLTYTYLMIHDRLLQIPKNQGNNTEPKFPHACVSQLGQCVIGRARQVMQVGHSGFQVTCSSTRLMHNIMHILTRTMHIHYHCRDISNH